MMRPLTGRTLLCVFQLTRRCQLKCAYCYCAKGAGQMSPGTAARAVEFLAGLKPRYDHITIGFMGGEPLMAWEALKRVVGLAQKRGLDAFCVATNARLLDPERMRFLAENNVSPQLSLHGIFDAARSGFCSVSWRKTERLLLSCGGWARRIAAANPNPFRVRLTVTPEGLELLSAAVERVAGLLAGMPVYLTVMPAMPGAGFLAADRRARLLPELRRQMRLIAELHERRAREGDPLVLTINECFNLDEWSGFASARGLEEAASCGAGSRVMAVAEDGGLYPCYLPAAAGMERFKGGDVWRGLVRPEAFRCFRGPGPNRGFSCLHWNRLETGRPEEPALLYRAFYLSWREQALRMRS
ncbi:MAG: radical SAM protein [Elusimicrobia bacterium]|nr:radical SAM protein [Elusimicrobiota bacterium]